jgi:hypothetical protein
VTGDFRLTRRGRLLLQTLPLFLVVATGVSALADRMSSGASHATAAVAGSSTPSPSATTRAPRPRASATPSPSATRKATPSPRPSATVAARPGWYGNGALRLVPGASAVGGRGALRRYTVEVERGITGDATAFAATVQRVLSDPRSWGGGGRLAFQRVSSGPVSFRVVLASPATTDRLCRPLRTGGIFSCYMAGRVVLNAMRWQAGADAYMGDLASYRIYMVNHEVGHALGHGHSYRCGAGGLAHVMIQQTKGLRGCRRNPWPLADER